MYTYLIGWSKLDKWYYGVRFSKKAKPEDLWIKYFTSSRVVKEFRKVNGEPDIIEIRHRFTEETKAREWETKVIKKMNAVLSDRWLNQTDNTHKFYHQGPRGPFSAEHKEKLAAAKRGRKISEEHKAKLHAGGRAHKWSEEEKLANSERQKGIQKPRDQVEKMRQKRLNDPRRFSWASNAGKISIEKRRERGQSDFLNFKSRWAQ